MTILGSYQRLKDPYRVAQLMLATLDINILLSTGWEITGALECIHIAWIYRPTILASFALLGLVGVYTHLVFA